MFTKRPYVTGYLMLAFFITVSSLTVIHGFQIVHAVGVYPQDSPCVSGPHAGTISSDQTWCVADNPHIVTGDVIVPEDVTLTIEPGVVVKFKGLHETPCSGCDLIVNGSLHASGTPSQTIRFTSGRNTPSKGDWGHLYFGEYSIRNVLEHVRIEYGGGGWFTDDMLYVCTDDLVIDHSTIHRSYSTGLSINDASPTVRNTVFEDNGGTAIYLGGGAALPVLSNLSASGNGYDAITIHGATYTQDYTWGGTGIPTYRLTADVTIASSASLTITPGTTIRLKAGGENIGLSVNGTLNAQGAPGELIRFTSDSVTPKNGDWSQIYFSENSTDNVLDYVLVEYGGDWLFHNAMVLVSTDDLIIDHSTVRRSDYTALKIYNASPTVRNTTFEDNEGSAILLAGGSAFPVLEGLSANGNTHDAITISSATSYTRDYTWGGVGIPNYRILANVTVDAGATLSVTPGTTLKFEGNKTRLNVNGTLNARGAPGEIIRFTSDNANPTKGNWNQIHFGENSTDNILDYAMVEYGGGWNPDGGMIYVSTDDLLIDHSTIRRSGNIALYIYNASPTVRNTEFEGNNGSALYLNGGSAFPVLANISANGNGHNSITINGCTYTQDYVWGGTGIPTYRIMSNVTVETDAILTIEPGTAIKFKAGMAAVGLTVKGTLNARGEPDETIYFTSESGTPAKGDWEHIYFTRSSKNNVMEYVSVEYGGSWLRNKENVRVDTSALAIRHCTITRSSSAGIRLNGGSPAIAYNRIVENDGYGLLNNDASVTAVARCNWWGDASGPYHPTQNPNGLGQRVSDHVIFSPWLTAPDARCAFNQIFLPMTIKDSP